MLILKCLSDWGKCLPHSSHTTMLSYGPQLPACPLWFQSAPRRYIGQGPDQAWDPFPLFDTNTPTVSFFTFLPLLARILLVLFWIGIAREDMFTSLFLCLAGGIFFKVSFKKFFILFLFLLRIAQVVILTPEFQQCCQLRGLVNYRAWTAFQKYSNNTWTLI